MQNDDEYDDEGLDGTPTRTFFRPRPDTSPPHPPWTYLFPSAIEYAAEYVHKIKPLEGGGVKTRRRGKTPAWRDETRLKEDSLFTGMTWATARQHWSRKAQFYACLDDVPKGPAAIEQLAAFFERENGNAQAAFRAFATSTAQKRKASPH